MIKAQIPLTILFLSVPLMVHASISSGTLKGIMEGEISGMELKSWIMVTEVSYCPRLGTEVASAGIYNENLEVIASGTACASRIMKLAHQCDLIITITVKQFHRLAYEHE